MKQHLVLSTRQAIQNLYQSLIRLEDANFDLEHLVVEVLWMAEDVSDMDIRWGNYMVTLKRQVGTLDGQIYEDALWSFFQAIVFQLQQVGAYNPEGILRYRYERMLHWDIVLRRQDLLPAP